jgi:hypothetical protein
MRAPRRSLWRGRTTEGQSLTKNRQPMLAIRMPEFIPLLENGL